MMKAKVFSLIFQNLKVVQRVVQFVFILVMHYLSGVQLST